MGNRQVRACAIRAALTDAIASTMDQIIQLNRQLGIEDLAEVFNGSIKQGRARKDVLLGEYTDHVRKHGCGVRAIVAPAWSELNRE